jgi:hypothetical protein
VEYGTSAGAYPSTTAAQALAAQSPATNYSFGLSGLAPGTTYHYVVVASTSHGALLSSDQTFTTAPVPTPAPGATTPTPAPTTTPKALPSNAFKVTKLKVAKTGKLSAALAAPDAGLFKVKASYSVTKKVTVHKKGKKVLEKKTTVYTYGTETLKTTKKSTKTLGIALAKAAKTELTKLGKAKVTLAVTFTPTGGKAATKRPTITVKHSRTGIYT